MPHHERVEVSGEIVDVFAHRFTIDTGRGRILADLGPKGVEAFPLEPRLRVVVSGEMKPSELKIDRIAREGAEAIEIAHKTPHESEPHHASADPQVALRAVTAAGLQPVGTPRRKPKHFEVLARNGRHFVECHVELDGHIRKEKTVAYDDHKWVDDLTAA